MSNSQVTFSYGKNLNTTAPYSAGKIYFDIANKQIWYDDPSNSSKTHTLMTSIGNITKGDSLPSSGKQNDIALVKGTSNTYLLYIYNNNSWTLLTEAISTDKVIYTGNTTTNLTQGATVTSALSSLEQGLTTLIEGKEPTIVLTASKALVSNASGKIAASKITTTELEQLEGVSSNIQTQIDAKAPIDHSTTEKTYGIPTSSKYGHVKLSNSVSSTSSTSAGVAATPKAVKTAYDLANSANTVATASLNTIQYDSATHALVATKNDETTVTATLPLASSTNYGLVKSGEDVTITNGIISVNDNGHKHTIENITNLSSELEGIKTSLNEKIEANKLNEITMYEINYGNRYQADFVKANGKYSNTLQAPVGEWFDTASITIGGISKNYLDYITLNFSTATILIPNVTQDVVISFSYTKDGSCCFIAGTQILTSFDGQIKTIEALVSGDNVVSYNTETREFYLAKVKKLIINKNTTDIAEVSFDNGEKLIMNAYHPIYTDTGFHSITRHNGYDELVVGDICRTKDGWTIVTDIKRYNSEPIITYNLDVIDIDETNDNEENDTFIANGIVVHNAAACPT